MPRQTLSARWWHLSQQLRFLVAGGYNTFFGYLTFVLLYLGCRSLHYLMIAVLANVIATVSAFVVHRTLVFRSTSAWAPEFMRFYASQLISVAFGTLLLYLLVRGFSLSPLSAQALVTAASVLVSYTLHRYFTFAKSRA